MGWVTAVLSNVAADAEDEYCATARRLSTRAILRRYACIPRSRTQRRVAMVYEKRADDAADKGLVIVPCSIQLSTYCRWLRGIVARMILSDDGNHAVDSWRTIDRASGQYS